MPFHLSYRRWFAAEPIISSLPNALQLARPIPAISSTDTLEKTIHLFRQLTITALPVTIHGTILIGWLREERLAECLAAGTDAQRPLKDIQIIDPLPGVIHPAMSLDEAVAVFDEQGTNILPVVSGSYYHGCLVRADVMAALSRRLAPPQVGGMATPLGVYLTTGRVSGGVGTLGLMLTGAVMSFMIWLLQYFMGVLMLVLYHRTHISTFDLLHRAVLEQPFSAPPVTGMMILLGVSTVLMGGFLLMLHFFPRMAGFHAAEHQTVNAIEAGEPLTPESVARMTRVHPRCGTNLWGLMSMIYLTVTVLSIVLTSGIGRQYLDVVVSGVFCAVLMIIASWRSIGGWLQHNFTTRPATRAELESGIRAGKEVLQRHLANPTARLRPAERIWRMGLLQVVIGAILMGAILQLLQWPLDYLVQSLVK